MENKTKTKIGIAMLLVVALLVSISFSSAYKLVCLSYGQSIPNAEIQRYRCDHDQCINICTTDNLYPTNPGFCTDFGACQSIGTPEVDASPPKFNVSSPSNDAVYDSTSVLFDLKFDEPSSIYWIDNINGRNIWKKICSNCDTSFLKSLRLSEGKNNITIKATDRNGNSAYSTKVFTIDSKDPKLKRIMPKGGFADGEFSVEFQEDNPVSLVLKCTDFVLQTNYSVNLNNDCSTYRGKTSCDFFMNISKYDGKEIQCNVKLTDIAGNSAEFRKPVTVEVDNTFPKVLNSPIYTQGVGKDSKYIYFNLSIDEKNFDEVVYTYYDSRGNLKEKPICSRLRNGVCEVRKSFSRGSYDLNVVVRDEAGNAVSYPVSFVVAY